MKWTEDSIKHTRKARTVCMLMPLTISFSTCVSTPSGLNPESSTFSTWISPVAFLAILLSSSVMVTSRILLKERCGGRTQSRSGCRFVSLSLSPSFSQRHSKYRGGFQSIYILYLDVWGPGFQPLSPFKLVSSPVSFHLFEETFRCFSVSGNQSASTIQFLSRHLRGSSVKVEKHGSNSQLKYLWFVDADWILSGRQTKGQMKKIKLPPGIRNMKKNCDNRILICD